MKKYVMILLITLMFVAPVSTTAQDTRLFYTFYPINCSMSSDINEMAESFITDREIVFEATPVTSPDSNETQISLGMAVLIIKFNKAYAPSIASIEVTINNESAIDMLHNFTYTDSDWSDTPSSSTIECKMIVAYIYLYANHSVFNPGHIDISGAVEVNPFKENNQVTVLSYDAQRDKISLKMKLIDLDLDETSIDETITNETITNETSTDEPNINETSIDKTSTDNQVPIIIIVSTSCISGLVCVIMLLNRRK